MKKRLTVLAIVGFMAGMAVAGGHKTPITGSFIGGTGVVTNRDLMCEIAAISATSPRADFDTSAILIQLVNTAGITNCLTPTYGTATHTQAVSWVDGGASYAWVQGGKIFFTCSQTNTVNYEIFTRD